MKNKRFSIKLKLSLMFILLFLLMTGLLTGFLMAISNRVYKTTQENILRNVISNNLSFVEGIQNGRLSLSEGFIYELSGVTVAVYNKNGALIAGQPPTYFIESVSFEDRTIRSLPTDNDSCLILDLYYPFSWEDGIWIRGFSELASQTGLFQNILIVMLISLPFFIALAGLLSYFLSSVSLKSLDQINAAAKSINSGNDLSKRINLRDGSREFVELSDNMDEMLTRLETSFENEKRFSSDVSHELRTPISVIKGAAEYSLKYDSKPQEYKESLEMILSNSDNMAKMVDSLLYISRLEQGKTPVNLRQTNLSELVAKCLLKYSTNERHICIKSEIAPNVSVSADEELFTLVINNLVENAIKYGKESGHILVCVENENGATIRIKDDGIGIPPEKLPHIFNRFYRVDESRNVEIKGTGLGLSLVYRIVTLHNANIDVKSILGLGTEFIIKF